MISASPKNDLARPKTILQGPKRSRKAQTDLARPSKVSQGHKRSRKAKNDLARQKTFSAIPITYIPSRFYSWTSLIFCCLRYPTPLPPPSSIPKWLLTDWPRRRWSYTRRPRRAGFALHYTSTTTSRRCNAGGCISRSSEKDCSQLTDLDRDDTDNRHCLYAVLYLSYSPPSRWNSVFKVIDEWKPYEIIRMANSIRFSMITYSAESMASAIVMNLYIMMY